VNQQTVPQVITLEAGTHWLCTCSQSKNTPYCDGSHKGTPFMPLTLELESSKQVEISR
jgi:CDGSH-type Zn-finger protein